MEMCLQILILQNNLNIGGAQKYGKEIAKAFNKHEVTIALTDPFTSHVESPKMLLYTGCNKLRIINYKDIFINKYDVCFVNSAPMGKYEDLVKTLKNLRNICVTMNVILHNPINPFSKNVMALRDDIIDNHIVVHTKLKNMLLTNNVIHKNIRVIYPSIDRFSVINKSTIKDKVICYYGRMLPDKGVKLLVQYWYHLHSKFPDWKLRLSGNCIPTTQKFLEQLLSYIKENALESSMILDIRDIKTVEEKKMIYENIDYFIQLSFSEGLPYTIIESFAHGVPVIHTNVGGVSEILNDNNGYLLNFKGLDGLEVGYFDQMYTKYFDHNLLILQNCFDTLLTSTKPLTISFDPTEFLSDKFQEKILTL